MAESLQQIQRLEALGVLAGVIAHYFDRALAIHGRAEGLTRQLLTFAKGGGPVRRVVSLGPLVRQSVAFALSGSEVEPSFTLPDDLWNCRVRRKSDRTGDRQPRAQRPPG